MTNSTAPTQPKPTAKELREALEKAHAEYNDLVEVHKDHIHSYDDAHKAIHTLNTDVVELEHHHHYMPTWEYEVVKEDYKGLRDEQGRQMINAREAVKDVRLQLREVKGKVRGPWGDADVDRSRADCFSVDRSQCWKGSWPRRRGEEVSGWRWVGGF